ncbi:hypothetical protein MHI43_13025 [Paenibacillus sp. FSL H8-0457]|uniref:hypothetical protein n=1 Tax=unclassified Paenibacillus TaxID=185978 RepID=UPI0003E27313|nr:hypothetical protein [Paenibacillus sp. FSL H8-457]ETT67661.1 hypothetical protein C172_05899 [Paenibacillus sp. FSL H8-457]
MREDLIYITEGITFKDLKEGKVKKTEIYIKQMRNWFIKPARLLLENSSKPGNYDQELSILTILITFFESHGQYLLGASSQGGSSRVFQSGFNAFIEYLVSEKKHDKEKYINLDRRVFYSLVRCGLLHNGYIMNDSVSFFIDRYKLDKVHIIYPNPIIIDSWLINTSNMLDCIENYLDHYYYLIETDDEYKDKFEIMFETFYSL